MRRGALLLSLLILAVTGTALVLTSLPLVDEGYYGVPAYFLATQGILRSPVMETAGEPIMTGIHTALYWMAPLAMVFQAAAFKLFGPALYVQRFVSLAAGLGVIGGWFYVLRQLLNSRIAGIACLLLSCDLVFVSLAVRGRADMLSLFFGVAALCLYLALREDRLTLALFASNCACVVSGLTHPNGGLSAVALLAVLAIALDRRRLRLLHAAAVIFPYVLGAMGWGMWIAKHPDYFEAQFIGNVLGRAPKTFQQAIAGEFWRYFRAYGFDPANRSSWVRAIFPLAYLAGIAGAWRLRGRAPNVGILYAMAAAQALVLFAFEGSKQAPYLVHSIPVFCGLTASWMVWLAERRKPIARMALAAQCAAPILMLAGLFMVVRARHYQNWFQPAAAVLNEKVARQGQAIAAADFFFSMRCKTCLTDDHNLGAFSGATPDVIVMDDDYRESLDNLRQKEPARYARIVSLLHERYKIVYENPAFQIYRRNT